MSIMPTPKQLADALAVVQKQVAEAQAGALNESHRLQLAALATRLNKAGADALTHYPGEMARAQKSLEESKARAQALQEQAAQLRQKALAAEEARKAAAAAPPPSPQKAIDPGLGRQLREELLEKFGRLPQGKPLPQGKSAAPQQGAAPAGKPETREMPAAAGKPEWDTAEWDTVDIPEEGHS